MLSTVMDTMVTRIALTLCLNLGNFANMILGEILKLDSYENVFFVTQTNV